MRNKHVRVMVEIALAVALSAVLNVLAVKLPINIAGGSISLDMVPILIVALRRGMLPGLVAGALWGTFDLVFDPYIVHPAQLILDYPLAFALVGLAGLGKPMIDRLIGRGELGKVGIATIPWVLLGGIGRFASHLVSGVIFFSENAPVGQSAWVYSAIYQVSYLAPSILGAIIVVALLIPTLARAVPVVGDDAA